jgi:hypothetical protein
MTIDPDNIPDPPEPSDTGYIPTDYILKGHGDEYEDPRIAAAEYEAANPHYDGDEADRLAERDYDRYWERRD